ncbi:MAG TPA: nicotinate-nucleotide adenylyltransferase [Alphaproteobacteria bacterium]|jgi:nicotinate-nucleotide adenylyltransferase
MNPQPTFSPPHLLNGARWAGMRVGLLGGSFNPPHEGHLHISLTALRALKLDFIWWLVTPHNPLKEATGLMPYEERVAQCHDIAQHPQILVTDIENMTGTNRSYDTISIIRATCPRTDFAWITGMDIAHQFHLWHRWQDILGLIATAHIARPPFQSLIQDCPLRLAMGQTHRVLSHAEKTDLSPRRSYWILDTPMMDISSTEIRNGPEI